MTSELPLVALALQPDWAEAAGTWVGGLGTVGALIYAMVGLRREADRRRADIERIAADQRNAQDAQARTVVLHDAYAELDGDGHDAAQILTVALHVGNYGTAPITSILGRMTYRGSPGEDVAVHPAFAFVIPAGEKETLTWHLPLAELPCGLPDASESLLYHVLQLFTVEVDFVDVHGTRWVFRYGPGEHATRRKQG